ncbi:hypothetical protein EON81_17340 [bacterium]|nr:MAG: hypothetical protein EON81_17340 [bacterium]
MRKALSWISLALLGGGYLGAMAMGLTNRGGEWAERMDQTPVRLLALLLIVSAIVFAFLPSKETDV